MPKDYGAAGGDTAPVATTKTAKELNAIENAREAQTQSVYTTTTEQQQAAALAELQDTTKTKAQRIAASAKLSGLIGTTIAKSTLEFTDYLAQVAKESETMAVASSTYEADAVAWETQLASADLIAQGQTAEAVAAETKAAEMQANPNNPIIVEVPPVVGQGKGGNPIIVGMGLPTTGKDLLKARLAAAGYPSYMLDTTIDFIDQLMKDNPELTEAKATDIFLNNPTYTLKNGVKLQSPFYTEFGYLNDKLDAAVKKSPGELMAYVNGVKNLKTKYDISDKYITSDAIQSYLKNDVSVLELDNRMGMAKLRALNADPAYSGALMKLGYINKPEDLTDFFLDPKIGEQELDLRRKNAAFTTEALRRSNEKTGITLDTAEFKKLTAGLTAKGYSEAQISTLASKGFQNISNELLTEVGLSNVYEGANAAKAETIQQELQAKEFLGLDSKRQNKLIDLEKGSYQASAGIMKTKTSTAGLY